MLDCLQLLHFHIGSQIPSTTLLTDGVEEAVQIYCELVRLGTSMQVIGIGGGMGIASNATSNPRPRALPPLPPSCASMCCSFLADLTF